MPKVKIRKGDHVVVITGKDKGKRGEVLKVLPADNRAIVKGVAMVRRHQKQTATQDGGIVSKEAAVNISNIAIEDPKDGKPTRVGYKFLKDGRKVRFAKRSGEVIDG
ncbi:MAG: 50S ribosomal protein L24 [Methyloceanibacter sp.]|uniref:50S ribosomal protein L24 n=1 Tax=Methyloceanibacter sp. TaxID=1965321 RepID=UPI003D9AFB83